ncbi:D-glycero-beta-D-manno-heptose 1,7-bisphosphate 7-phosphatase [Motilimonas eburnea]|uniref:D-glycero-beta-D-manno-heptose 1,7-bisphosphate 7-phosphatase n=1 Tax=Motilimonas eburnea TaxID=1737488 RepID=UPI001E34E94D|nr:D-glycero-beta-D-manno-heptose 1,7-bisphosphate 7-phosphatase [Motilimonas eburnea]
MSKPAVFIDRDGVLNVDHGYVYEVDDFEFIDGAIEACQEIKQKGYLLILVTNQSGIGRGYYTEDEFHNLTEWMDWSLADRGVDLDGIYYCPHHPEAVVAEFKQECDCRKPAPGMLLTAAKELNVDMAKSYFVGDKTADILAGKAAGVATNVLVETGKALTQEGIEQADFVEKDLRAFAATLTKI